jgi:hypothetical protein
MPGFFKTWARVAWGDLLNTRPEEDEAELGQDAPAREEFWRLVREAMLGQVVLGDVITGEVTQTQIERRALIDWCVRFAKLGRWQSIRSYRCWCKLVELPGGEIRLRVAIRHELFAQLKADRRLVEMGAKKFARRAARYGVGRATEDDRPHGQRALVLADDLVAELADNLPDEGEEICRTS